MKRLLCWLDRHDWDVASIEHQLAHPSSYAFTIPVRVQRCKRQGCHERLSEVVL